MPPLTRCGELLFLAPKLSGFFFPPTDQKFIRSIFLFLISFSHDPTRPHECLTVMVLPEVTLLVNITAFCLISSIVAPAGVTTPAEPAAAQLVKATVPKFANGTRPLDVEKSSTIHSALTLERAGCAEKVWLTLVPRDTFLTVATPPVVDVATTEIVTVSPAAMAMPLKS